MSESGGSEEELEQTKFETADAGASHTYPQTASGVRKGGFMVIKGRPCKVPAAARRCPRRLQRPCMAYSACGGGMAAEYAMLHLPASPASPPPPAP
jgi:hypothetical protein